MAREGTKKKGRRMEGICIAGDIFVGREEVWFSGFLEMVEDMKISEIENGRYGKDGSIHRN